ncbi:MAG: class II fructose-bisphosphate aldolase family protein [bacterium]|nr:class II fructose-bisphosphate aldolase family protein [bacterium]
MSLIPMKEILQDAYLKKYAVGAFNTNNMEITQAIFNAAKEEKSPLIIMCSDTAIKYMGMDYLIAMIKAGAKESGIPAALHLDHGKSIDIALQCIKSGFTSVMIDGSHLDFKGNVEITKEVIKAARPARVTVEAELGKLGGIEDNVIVLGKDACLTDPQEAVKFVTDTDVDALAVAVGTSHGAYKFEGDAILDIERILTIRHAVNIPLVLHGASGVSEEVINKATMYGAHLPGAKGVPEESIKKAIENGITKINIDTDIRLFFTTAIREILFTKPDIFDPRKICGPAREAVKETVRVKMKLFGSSGKA